MQGFISSLAGSACCRLFRAAAFHADRDTNSSHIPANPTSHLTAAHRDFLVYAFA
jgi:hypothetical protein